GEVQEIIPPQNASQTGLYQEATVKPAVEFTRLEGVFVNIGKGIGPIHAPPSGSKKKEKEEKKEKEKATR
ncbi:MAG: hypothetical protein JO317_07305, partial [Verrucomicrobiae bacterium]|nr:hypothetical protein [Verrucomicrobiae bacterium]